jgi:hypothetical protein
MTLESEAPREFIDEDEISRSETGVRLLLTLLFFIIGRLAETVLVLIALFGIFYTLVTQRPPGDELRRFARRTISFLVEIARYITYDDEEAPFPFREFPAELDLRTPARAGRS